MSVAVGFVNELDIRDTLGRFTLLTPLIYLTDLVSRPTIVVPSGFYTDGASVPRVLWSIYPRLGCPYDAPAVLHDYLYYSGYVTRALADAILREAMRSCGCDAFTCSVFYAGVRLGGGSTWERYRRGL